MGRSTADLRFLGERISEEIERNVKLEKAKMDYLAGKIAEILVRVM